jgi:hypothetical protein
MVMSPAGLETKNNCAGEGQQKFSSQSVKLVSWQSTIGAMSQWWDGSRQETTWAEEDIVEIRGQTTTSEDYNRLRLSVCCSDF